MPAARASIGDASPLSERGDIARWAPQGIERDRTWRRVGVYLLLIALLVSGSYLLRGHVWSSTPQVHTLFEVAAAGLALIVGVIALVRFYSRRSDTLLFVGTAFLGTALLDGYHAFVTSGILGERIPSALTNLIPWSWFVARLFLGFILLAGCVLWFRTRRERWAAASTGPVYRTVFTVAGLMFAFLAFVPLPRAHYPELLFTRPAELIAGLLFFGALVGYLLRGHWRRDPLDHWLVMSLIVATSMQGYMSVSSELFDDNFDAAHILKIVSYALVLVGLLISMYRLFQQAESSAERLAVKNEQLRTQADDLAEARDRALEATAVKSQFLANVSHEIRTPMNAILGMTELALSTDLTAEQREYLGTAKRAVEALIRLVNDLLDLAKVEAGRLQLEDIPFSLADTVGDTVRTLASRASAKGVELRLENLDRVPDGVSGDPGRLRQILVNLIGNAIKFTHVGHVTVEIEVWDETADDVELHFSVADTGIGVPADKKDLIFEAFSQADASMSREYGGTGLGLAITAQLVEMMGGRIWMDSEVGIGSVFHFTLRLRKSHENVYFSPSNGDIGVPRVMIVGDTESNRRSSTEMVRQAGLQVYLIRTPEEADVAAVAAMVDRPDVVLVAVDEDPLRVCKRIGAATGNSVPVVALVPEGVPGDAALFRRAGAAGYFPKPTMAGDLADALRHAALEWQPGDPLVTTHWLRERRSKLNVLLADDSPANRRLATRLLEKRGHTVMAVDNGRQAVQAAADNRFDVVLMDVQMPLLDGLAATKEIRDAEAGSGTRVPIVALTAHANVSDREQCLAAGMDAYVSKPFNAEELYATVEQLGGASAVAFAMAGVEPPPAAVDVATALDTVGGAHDVLAEVVAMFMETYPGQMTSIALGFGAGDMETVAEVAHSLKGTLAMLGAEAAFHAATELEELAGRSEITQGGEAWLRLQAEMERAEPELIRLGQPIDSAAAGD